MRRILPPLAVASALALITAVPSFATTPQGGPNPGLIDHTADQCTGIADTHMLLSAGSTFWMGGVHYLVKSVTYTGAYTGTYTYGQKAGLTGAIECYGTGTAANGQTYTIHSTDVPVP